MRPAKNRGGLEEPPSRGRVRTRGAGPRTGVQTREQLEDAACTKVEAPPDTRRHEVLVLGKQGSRSRLLHVPISGADSYTYRTRRVPFEILLPPRRGAAPRVGALVFILGTHPGLVGPIIEGPTETTRHAPPVPRLGGPAVSAAPAPPKLDIPRLLGPQVTPGPNGGHYFAPWPR